MILEANRRCVLELCVVRTGGAPSEPRHPLDLSAQRDSLQTLVYIGVGGAKWIFYFWTLRALSISLSLSRCAGVSANQGDVRALTSVRRCAKVRVKAKSLLQLVGSLIQTIKLGSD